MSDTPVRVDLQGSQGGDRQCIPCHVLDQRSAQSLLGFVSVFELFPEHDPPTSRVPGEGDIRCNINTVNSLDIGALKLSCLAQSPRDLIVEIDKAVRLSADSAQLLCVFGRRQEVTIIISSSGVTKAAVRGVTAEPLHSVLTMAGAVEEFHLSISGLYIRPWPHVFDRPETGLSNTTGETWTERHSLSLVQTRSL